jgi:SRSO17 transposase
MVTRADAACWAREFDEVMERIGRRFGRVEPRRRAAAYLQGLLAPLERKNGWHLAEAAGDVTPTGVHEFLGRVHWDAEGVRDDLQADVGQHLGDPQAVLVLDETGFLKKGTKSAGVQRQYTGTAGRIENAQVGVFLAYASRHGHALIDRALYLPRSWTADRARCREARVPESIGFATKPMLGLAMLQRAQAAGVPFAWVTGDSVYGSDHRIRRFCEEAKRGYVLTVTRKQRLGLRPVRAWIADLPAGAWQRLSAGDGAKGPRVSDWACLPYGGGAEGFQCALLVRRSLAEPQEPTYFLTHAPQGTPLADLVRIAGTRWTIETCFEQAKGEVGLDEYEVRSYPGWHRHVTLAMLAHAYLAVLRRAAIGGSGGSRPRRRVPAADPARDPPPPGGIGRSTPAPRQRRDPLVVVATPPPADRTPRALETTNATATL